MDPVAAFSAELARIDQGTLIMVFGLLVAVLIFLSIPPFLVLFSRKVSGARKVWWFLLTSLFSWLAYVPFVLMLRRQSKEDQENAGPPAQGGG